MSPDYWGYTQTTTGTSTQPWYYTGTGTQIYSSQIHPQYVAPPPTPKPPRKLTALERLEERISDWVEWEADVAWT
jgi:hypothetical protein